MSKKPEPEFVPISAWGRDHFSTLAYIETRCVDHRGTVDNRHLRADPKLHPGLADARNYIDGVVGGTARVNRNPKISPTRLKDGVEKAQHDDWSCIEDMEAAGLLEWNGTGMNPVFKLTTLGKIAAASLRAHKRDGGWFSNFTPSLELQAKVAAKIEAMAQEEAEAEEVAK